jgi:5-methylcytosine-specific restriction endonuclease McrA
MYKSRIKFFNSKKVASKRKEALLKMSEPVVEKPNPYLLADQQKKLDPDYIKREREALRLGVGWFKENKPKVVKVKTGRKLKPIPKCKPMAYPEFLKSDYWFMVRDLVKARDNHTCVVCGSKKWLDVHHKTYKHHFAEHKHLEILVTLCRKCHKAEHARLDSIKKPNLIGFSVLP